MKKEVEGSATYLGAVYACIPAFICNALIVIRYGNKVLKLRAT
jgi:hypothetical protein